MPDAALARAGFENNPDPIIFGNSDRTIVLANPAAARLFEYESPASMVGLPVYALVPEDLIPETVHDRLYDAFIQGRRTREMGKEAPLLGKTKTGRQIPIWLKLFIVTHEGKTYVGEAVRDRTEYLEQEKRIEAQKQQERELIVRLEQSNEDLISANRRLNSANEDMQVQLRRSELQELVVKWLIYAGLFFYLTPFVLSIFRRVPTELMSFGRDVTILVIGALVNATGAAVGIVSKAKDTVAKRVEPEANSGPRGKND